MKYSPTLARLIEALRCLPGVGPKSAQRMAFHLLERDRDGGRELAAALGDAVDGTSAIASTCRMLTEGELCPTLRPDQRDASLLCVVESPADVVAVGAVREFPRTLLRAHGPSVAARWRGPGATRARRARRTLVGRRGARSDRRDQPDRGGRRDRARHLARWRRGAAYARRGSLTVCRSAASSSMSMAVRSRTP